MGASVLVAGGTGTLGKLVVGLLTARGVGVRVLTRRGGADDEVGGPHVEIAVGDVRDPRSVGRALEGVSTVVSAIHGFLDKEGPRAIDRDGNAALVAAARAASVRRLILLSIAGAAADSPMELFRMKWAAEQDLKRSGLGWTIVRPTAYMETWLGLIAAPLIQTGNVRVFGRGRNRINFTSARDVADVVAAAVLDSTKDGSTIDVGGPEDLSFDDLVHVAEEATGRIATTTHVPLPMMRAMSVLMKPVDPILARQIQGGVFMDTADLSFATVIKGSASWVRGKTTLREVVERDYVREAAPAMA